MEVFVMTSMGAGEFKGKCLQLLDDVAAKREPLVITKFGKPVARIMPMPPAMKLRGALKGSVLFEGDIVSPLENEWEAAR
jgi:prevent-host-death family protein